MVGEIEALYADTRAETGLAAMSGAIRHAMGRVERHRFLPEAAAPAAYGNHPLAIGEGQTISQPYIVALSTDLLGLEGGETVLDVGTGSGYQAAVLAEIAAKVCSIEIIESHAREASRRLRDLGYGNVEVRTGDAHAGWPEKASFDAIVVAAAALEVPRALAEQLKPGGRMVIPLESGGRQYLTAVLRRLDGGYGERRILPVRFVPLVGKA